jgi:NAD(P)-dependent dehydrogenase (short-subunit alcohol dehydrogenase family)
VCAPYFLVQAALPALARSPDPIVVNISPAAAVMYRPRQTVYGLAKAGLEHMTLNMAAELAPERIRVACVRPGPVLTDLHLAGGNPGDRVRSLRALVPLARMGEPVEIALWVWHLVDPAARWVAGTVVTVDGVRTLGAPEVPKAPRE